MAILGMCAFFSLSYLIILARVDRFQLRVDRWSITTEFLRILLGGSYPYNAASHLGGSASTFPCNYLFALPAYFLGDVGYQQILGFLLFAFVACRRWCDSGQRAIAICLVGTSPSFLFEVAARSDLFTNMAFVALLIHALDRQGSTRSTASVTAMGFLGGLVLSTRGVVVFPLMFYLGGYLRMSGIRKTLVFAAAASATCISTILVFVLWDPESFLHVFNPFMIQSGQIPTAILVPALILSVLLSWSTKTVERSYLLSSIVLFVLVAILWIRGISAAGFQDPFHHFDISYFQFCMPFCFLSGNWSVLPGGPAKAPVPPEQAIEMI